LRPTAAIRHALECGAAASGSIADRFRAILALACRLAVIMHRMWRDGTEFRWTRQAAPAT
jgi:hypothetical protein